MQYEFFSLPIRNIQPAREELNRFLRSRRVINVRTEFVSQGENSFWAMAVEYIDGECCIKGTISAKKPKVDYRVELSETDFRTYSRLRELRKALAEAEAVPVYALFTNDQLAEMVKRKAKTKADIGRIDGVGQVKLDKYAEKFLKVISTGQNEESGKPD